MFRKSSAALRLRRPIQAIFELDRLDREDRVVNEAIIRGMCANAYLGENMAICRSLGRYKMFVDTRDVGLSMHLMLDGYWEMWLTEVIASSVKKGMIAADIGANLGYFSLIMADRVGSTGRVTAFEPNPGLAERLRMTTRANGMEDRLQVREIALGENEGALYRLIVADDEPKNGYIVPAGADDHLAMPGVFAVHRFDSFDDLLNVDIIKIDADTAEQAIWRGMRRVFDQGRPLTLFVEFNVDRYLEPIGFLSEMVNEGFSLARVEFEQGVVPCTIDSIVHYPIKQDQMLMITR